MDNSILNSHRSHIAHSYESVHYSSPKPHPSEAIKNVTRKKNTPSRFKSQRLGRWWKWNYNEQLDIKFKQNSHCSSSNPPPSEHEKLNVEEKNTSLHSTSQSIRRCWEQNWNGQFDIEIIQKLHCSSCQSTTVRGHQKMERRREKYFPTLHTSNYIF